jgi:hypothetical protein
VLRKDANVRPIDALVTPDGSGAVGNHRNVRFVTAGRERPLLLLSEGWAHRSPGARTGTVLTF